MVENGEEAVYEEKKIEEMEVICLIDRFGYVKTVDMATYERNKEAADTENKYIFPCKNTGRICVFTNTGQLHTIKVSDLPFGKFRDKGIPLDNVSNYSAEKEHILLATGQSQLNMYRVIFGTKLSMLKIVDGGEFDVKGAVGVRGMKLGNKDYVENIHYTQNTVEQWIEYKGKNLELNRLKAGKRDSKGTKPRG